MNLRFLGGIALFSCLAAGASAAPYQLDGYWYEVDYWAGEAADSGANETIIVIDWNDTNAPVGGYTTPMHAFGYRWTGTETILDALNAIAAGGAFSFQNINFGAGFVDYAFYNDGVDNHTNQTPNDYSGWVWLGDSADGGATWTANTDGIDIETLTVGQIEGINLNPGQWTNANLTVPVPEPGTGVLLAGLSSLMLLRRRREVRVSKRATRRALPGFAALGALAAVGLAAAPAAHASPFAVEVIEYTKSGAYDSSASYRTDGSQALGAPERDTSFGSQVGVFYGPFGTDELVGLGAGDHLTVRMGSRVTDDPSNPFGIDLIVHGNFFYVRSQDGTTTGAGFAEPGTIEVSSNGSDWFTIQNAFADTAFPTLGYTDTVYSGFNNSGGTIETNWFLPVDPSLDVSGMTEAQINAAYNGSAGGTGVDLLAGLLPADYGQLLIDGGTGLPYIEYVRVTQSSGTTEVQAFVNVPEPASLALMIVATGMVVTRRRVRRSV